MSYMDVAVILLAGVGILIYASMPLLLIWAVWPLFEKRE
jgi:hypothetical protein